MRFESLLVVGDTLERYVGGQAGVMDELCTTQLGVERGERAGRKREEKPVGP